MYKRKESGLYVKKWNGSNWEFKELRVKNKVKFSWRFVGLLVCLLLGMFAGYLIDIFR